MVSESDILEGSVALASLSIPPPPHLRMGIDDPTHLIDLGLPFPVWIFHMIPSPLVPFSFRPFFHRY